MTWRIVLCIGLALLGARGAEAADCPGNPNALGTSRVLTIDPQEFPRIGTVQYSRSLPLEDKEVVLTFDDGPLPPYTNRILEVLAEHCVRANYFIIGRMARGYPELLKKIAADGHVIGNHSQNHPLAFERMPLAAVQTEIEQGFASLSASLGDRRLVAPFFRIPGLLRAKEVEGYLQSRGLVTWSADVVADDWKHINASEVVRRAISRLDEKGKGILLLHDIQPATALALPELLRELKAKGYRIVQVVPRGTPAPQPVPVARAAPPAPVAVARAPVPLMVPPRREAAEPVAAPADAPLPVSAAEPPPAARPEPAVVRREPQAVASAPVDQPAESREAPATVAPARDIPIPPAAADSLARGTHGVPQDPVRPFMSGSKPARNMPTPGKFISTEPGGWPQVVSVPVPKAGGVGVSTVPRGASVQNGRFQ